MLAGVKEIEFLLCHAWHDFDDSVPDADAVVFTGRQLLIVQLSRPSQGHQVHPWRSRRERGSIGKSEIKTKSTHQLTGNDDSVRISIHADLDPGRMDLHHLVQSHINLLETIE